MHTCACRHACYRRVSTAQLLDDRKDRLTFLPVVHLHASSSHCCSVTFFVLSLNPLWVSLSLSLRSISLSLISSLNPSGSSPKASAFAPSSYSIRPRHHYYGACTSSALQWCCLIQDIVLCRSSLRRVRVSPLNQILAHTGFLRLGQILADEHFLRKRSRHFWQGSLKFGVNN